MCTVTFLPTQSGYIVAMNRDDLFARSQTSAPEIVRTGDRSALFPIETSGGTWIGTNDAGLTLCLLNWARPSGPKLRSRGEVIPLLLTCSSLSQAADALAGDVLAGRLPFRLVGFSLSESAVHEWRFDGARVTARLRFPWERNHWFSSGLSDAEARRQRLAVCNSALAQKDAFSTEWLRRLHRSHLPERGPFSICAHRSEAGTLSYTEVVVSAESSEVRYSDASPCLEHPLRAAQMPVVSAALCPQSLVCKQKERV